MTEKEIREYANRVYLRSPINFHYRENLKRAFVDGATWINNLNQKEIEELKQQIAERDKIIKTMRCCGNCMWEHNRGLTCFYCKESDHEEGWSPSYDLYTNPSPND